MDRLLNVITVWAGILILAVLVLVRRAHIRVEYSVSWLLAGVAVLALARWRGLLDWLAAAMGIGSPPQALLVLAGGVFLAVLFRISLIVSQLKDANIALAQRVAILEFRLESLDEKTKAATAS